MTPRALPRQRRSEVPDIRRVLIANRGEIAIRVLRACRELGIEAVVAVSDADRTSLAARLADDVVCIGPAPARDSYLCREAVVTAALAKGVDAVHPGYGFLSEDAEFAHLCQENSLTFIGPRPEVLRLFGDKVAAKHAANAAGVPIAGASAVLDSVNEAVAVAEGFGYPVILKAAKGGGGRGMRIAWTRAEVEEAFGPASAEAAAAFGDGRMYLEKFLPRTRHVEVQIAGDGDGHVIDLGDRDCSIQRKHQKLIEEAPAADLPAELQAEIRAAAIRLGQHVGYDSLGTVEFVVDAKRGDVSFLEVNARLQVEHGVTEQVTGVDLVRLQIGLAEAPGRALPAASVQTHGSAMECRLNAEAPDHGFRPSPGRLTAWRPPRGFGVRVDTHCYEGYTVPPYYDSLIAKVMCHATTREAAIALTIDSLDRFRIDGVSTTRELLRDVVGSEAFGRCEYWTRWLEEVYLPAAAGAVA